jgi:hypothetical protein
VREGERKESGNEPKEGKGKGKGKGKKESPFTCQPEEGLFYLSLDGVLARLHLKAFVVSAIIL